jgi:metal-responsive CopG/Arc/MetJ family transcriptional regulator
MKPISLKLPDSLNRQVASLARRRRLSKSAIIRQAIQSSVTAHGERIKARKGSFLEMAGDLIGSIHSGLGDLSTNPKYMESFGK